MIIKGCVPPGGAYSDSWRTENTAGTHSSLGRMWANNSNRFFRALGSSALARDRKKGVMTTNCDFYFLLESEHCHTLGERLKSDASGSESPMSQDTY